MNWPLWMKSVFVTSGIGIEGVQIFTSSAHVANLPALNWLYLFGLTFCTINISSISIKDAFLSKTEALTVVDRIFRVFITNVEKILSLDVECWVFRS
eukprot:TRINITY_DN4443_c0_g1_i1.p1 TRINITY_DN4443_c0_g1~~TRINITY_DN4443_c0_g1_i1.p1  ORF type:complete len:97 (-),score=0.98 TRINITY_DN4443_c0_g1_i1:256-546(-)